MSENQKAVHVSPTGENWEVESDAATLAQAESKQEAIEAAKEVAPQVDASAILVHTSDGRIEQEIPTAGRAVDPRSGAAAQGSEK